AELLVHALPLRRVLPLVGLGLGPGPHPARAVSLDLHVLSTGSTRQLIRHITTLPALRRGACQAPAARRSPIAICNRLYSSQSEGGQSKSVSVDVVTRTDPWAVSEVRTWPCGGHDVQAAAVQPRCRDPWPRQARAPTRPTWDERCDARGAPPRRATEARRALEARPRGAAPSSWTPPSPTPATRGRSARPSTGRGLGSSGRAGFHRIHIWAS